MKKFFEKYDLVKLSLVMILVCVLLSWIVPTVDFTTGKAVIGETYNRIGLFNFFTYGLLGMYYFTLAVTFVFVVGAFYQFLSKLDSYQKLTDTLAKKIQGKEILFSLITSFVFAALASIINEQLVLFAFIPFVITLCSKAKMDKLSSFITTFGAVLVGVIGATISTKISGMNANYFYLDITDSLVTKIIVFTVAFVVYSLFNILYLKKATKIKEYSKETMIMLGYYFGIVALMIIGLFFAQHLVGKTLLIVSIVLYVISGLLEVLTYVSTAFIYKKAKKHWWAIFIPFYITIVEIDVAKLPRYYFWLLLIPFYNIYVYFKIKINVAKQFGKNTAFGVGLTILPFIFGPMLGFSKVEYGKNVNKKDDKKSNSNVVVIETQEDMFASKSASSKTTNTIPLIVVMSLLAVVLLLAFMPWTSVFKVDWFTKAYNWVTELTLFNKPVFSYILDGVVEFGTWDLFAAQCVMVLSILVLKLIYKVSLDDTIEAMGEGLKKSSKLVITLLLSYAILQFAVLFPTVPTAITNLLGEEFNVIPTMISGLLTGLFTGEYQYALNLVIYNFSTLYTNNLSVVGFILQTTYGLMSFITPASILLFVGLRYTDVKYKDWFKYIWKFLLIMLVVITVIAYII